MAGTSLAATGQRRALLGVSELCFCNLPFPFLEDLFCRTVRSMGSPVIKVPGTYSGSQQGGYLASQLEFDLSQGRGLENKVQMASKLAKTTSGSYREVVQ